MINDCDEMNLRQTKAVARSCRRRLRHKRAKASFPLDIISFTCKPPSHRLRPLWVPPAEVGSPPLPELTSGGAQSGPRCSSPADPESTYPCLADSSSFAPPPESFLVFQTPTVPGIGWSFWPRPACSPCPVPDPPSRLTSCPHPGHRLRLGLDYFDDAGVQHQWCHQRLRPPPFHRFYQQCVRRPKLRRPPQRGRSLGPFFADSAASPTCAAARVSAASAAAFARAPFVFFGWEG